MSTSCSTTVGYSALPGFNRIFQTYLSDFDRVGSFFAGNPSRFADLERAAQRASAYPRDREALVRVLERQNAHWGAPVEVFDALQDLRHPNTVAVVTGQQTGLFLGPLYTLHKALTALRLAEDFTLRTKRKAVAVFWLHGEDHDFAEMDHAVFPSAERPVTVRYQSQAKGGPVGRMVIEDDILRILRDTEALVSGLPYGNEIMVHLRETWIPGRTFVDAFALTLRHLLPEAPLIFLNPDDPDLKALLAPLFTRVVTERTSLFDALTHDSDRLSAQGYTPTVRFNPLSLFHLKEGRRDVISPDGRDGFHAGGQAWTHTELLDALQHHPETFSPNVVTRPLAQDTLLPTMAYVGGPGEIAYFAQLKSAYAWAGIPMPIVFPRASLTLVDSRSCRALNRADMRLEDLNETDPERIVHRAFLAQGHEKEPHITRIRDAVQRLLGEMASPEWQLSQGSLQTLSSAQVRIDRELERLSAALLRAEKRKHQDLRAGLLHAWQHLFPHGLLQERGLGVLALVARTGSGSINALSDLVSLSPWAGHQVVPF